MRMKSKRFLYYFYSKSKAKCVRPTPVSARNRAVWSFIRRNILIVQGRNECTIPNVQLGIHDEVDVGFELFSHFCFLLNLQGLQGDSSYRASYYPTCSM